MSEEDLRREFQAWALESTHPARLAFSLGSYDEDEIHRMWLAYQEAHRRATAWRPMSEAPRDRRMMVKFTDDEILIVSTLRELEDFALDMAIGWLPIPPAQESQK